MVVDLMLETGTSHEENKFLILPEDIAMAPLVVSYHPYLI